MQYEYLFLLMLVFTIVAEMACLYLLVRYFYKISFKVISTSLIIFAGCVSFATLPYVWFVFPQLITFSYFWYVLIAELAVLFLEAIFYYFVLKLGFPRSLFISFVCNLTSFLLGFAVYRIMGI